MRFTLIDAVLDISADRIIALKNVSAAEEYLGDHFPTFPVLPGVFMLETMVQAARRLEASRGGEPRLVFGSARAIRYGTFVPPGSSLRVEIDRVGDGDDGEVQFKGRGFRIDGATIAGDDAEPMVAVSGRFSLRPMRLVGGHDVVGYHHGSELTTERPG
ncbi:MAG: beta-hydroxyacyl-ACP dehydratase [Planctomycetota bacterium]